MSQWAEIRHLHLVERVPKKEIARRLKLDVKTVRRAISRSTPPVRVSPPRPGTLDPWRERIRQRLREEVGRHHVAPAGRRPRRPGTLFPDRGHAFNRRPRLLVLVAGHRKEQRHTPLLPCARISRSPLVVVPQHDCPHHSPSLEFLSSLVDARSTRRRPRASRTRRSPTRSREGGGATVVVRRL